MRKGTLPTRARKSKRGEQQDEIIPKRGKEKKESAKRKMIDAIKRII